MRPNKLNIMQTYFLFFIFYFSCLGLSAQGDSIMSFKYSIKHLKKSICIEIEKKNVSKSDTIITYGIQSKNHVIYNKENIKPILKDSILDPIFIHDFLAEAKIILDDNVLPECIILCPGERYSYKLEISNKEQPKIKYILERYQIIKKIVSYKDGRLRYPLNVGKYMTKDNSIKFIIKL